ncbi:MAG TPA: IclR family transcriptional regulator [Solirubrobacteraceae bacterium]|nr:IclR family transcriptional regulator [Solirubrobacteraceae bacterium]
MQITQPSAPSSLLQTADRALQVLLEFRAPGEVLTVSGLAGRLGLNRSTTSRLVSTLEARGFLERLPGDGLQLGPAAARLGRIALAGRDLVSIARPVMEELAQETGEAVTLAVPAGREALTVAEAGGRHFVSSLNWTGVRTPGHCTSDGKVLLAFGAIPFPSGVLQHLTPRTITDPETLEQELAAVRLRGFAVARSELEAGLHGLAVPVFDAGSCVAALCVSGPEYRLRAGFDETLAPKCRAAAARIERKLDAGTEVVAGAA